MACKKSHSIVGFFTQEYHKKCIYYVTFFVFEMSWNLNLNDGDFGVEKLDFWQISNQTCDGWFSIKFCNFQIIVFRTFEWFCAFSVGFWQDTILNSIKMSWGRILIAVFPLDLLYESPQKLWIKKIARTNEPT